MGQKVSPIGFRVGIYQPWRSRWYANKQEFGRLLLEDQKIRRYIKREFGFAAIPKIEIERSGESVRVIIHTARPGILIGKKGAKIDRLKQDLESRTGKRVFIVTAEITKPELDAQLVAESIAEQLQKRAAFRRTLKRSLQASMQEGAQGIKIKVSGRLGGSEMARTEKASDGKVPLQTLRADVDYGFTEAKISAGHIGVKVWIYRGAVPRKAKQLKLNRPQPAMN